MIIHVFDVYAILIYNNMKQKAKDQWIHHKLSVKGISFSKMYDVIIWIIHVSSGRGKLFLYFIFISIIMNLAFSFWGVVFTFSFCIWFLLAKILFCVVLYSSCLYLRYVCVYESKSIKPRKKLFQILK